MKQSDNVMKFNLLTIAYVFALLAAGMAVFGSMGLFIGACIVFFWVTMFREPSVFFWWVVGGLTAVVVIVMLLTPSVGSSRGGVRNSCLNNLKQIGLALSNYESAHGAYPPPFVADADGKPMHSWRVLILPYMEHQSLYAAYNFDEPWDGPNNRKLWDQMPDVYSCPGVDQARRRGVLSRDEAPEHTSHYVAVVDRSTIWNVDRPTSYSAISDGPSNTILLVEYSGGRLPWTAPVDLTLEEAIDELTSDNPQGHVHVIDSYFSTAMYHRFRLALFGDAHGRSFPGEMDREEARALLTIAGGEALDVET
ncbi:MAG: DUF1559 domain-containing protein, partial [Pirellulales bacterium]|nr:DUF1559 domain-containing protein [Pirellulales bacterium]